MIKHVNRLYIISKPLFILTTVHYNYKKKATSLACIKQYHSSTFCRLPKSGPTDKVATSFVKKVSSALERLYETPEQKALRLERELLTKHVEEFVDTTNLSYEEVVDFVKNPKAFRDKHILKIKQKTSLPDLYEGLRSKSNEYEIFLKSKMSVDEIKAWDAEYNNTTENGGDTVATLTPEQQNRKELEIAERINVLQNRKILQDDLLSGPKNPFLRPKVEGLPVELEDLSIEGRVLNVDYDPTLDDPIIHVDESSPQGSGLVTNYHASRFYEYFAKRNPLPQGYFYFNETPGLHESTSDDDGIVLKTNENGTETVDLDLTKHLVVRTLHADTMQPSTNKYLTADDKKASVRVVAGHEINEHFDVSMVRKTPENLALLEDSEFLATYSVPNVKELRAEEAERLELLVADTPGSVKARPINKHVAFFKKPHAARTEMEDFVHYRTLQLEEEEASGENENTFFWMFLGWLGYSSAWRKERLTKWRKFLSDREVKIVEGAKYDEYGRIRLTPTGEIPDPEPIPEDFYRRDSFDKPAYFERRNAKYPERYNNAWYDTEIIDVLEPPYDFFEHFVFIIFELLERVHGESLKNYTPDGDYLPLEPTIETTWLDPSVAEMVESDFAILPGHRMEPWYSLFYGRWDDPLYTSDYQRCVDLYDDLIRMGYKKKYWFESYPTWLKKLLLWFDVFLHLFFLIGALVWFDPFCFFMYIFFCSVVELITWD